MYDYDCNECDFSYRLYYPDGSLKCLVCDMTYDDFSDPDIITPFYINRF